MIGDGAKYLCNLHHIKAQSSCVYYGFGVDGEVSFDEALVELLPGCEKHAFDPTEGVQRGKMLREF